MEELSPTAKNDSVLLMRHLNNRGFFNDIVYNGYHSFVDGNSK